MRKVLISIWAAFFLQVLPFNASAQSIDLFKQYPTTLSASKAPDQKPREWDFTFKDMFHLSRFEFAISNIVRVTTGSAELGIGHCVDGAVWAVIIPNSEGALTSPATNQSEKPSHIWLRFHPTQIAQLFPADTISPSSATNLLSEMRAIANAKITSSWQAGGLALIPPAKDMTLDTDVQNGLRRFFIVDRQAATAEYVPAFEHRPVRLPPPFRSDLAASAFDQLWQAFDAKYAMFVLRPEIDWQRLRDEYRPRALAAKSTIEFASICADMLKALRDLHVSLRVADLDLPVYNRPRAANFNPAGIRALIHAASREVHEQGRLVWAVTTNRIGYILIAGWSDSTIPEKFSLALEQMRDTRGLIFDVRPNGGGDEPTAAKAAARFVDKEFAYAFSQYRNGPNHTNLTSNFARKVKPSGPWRYDRPVLLLIGQKCMSSNESFIGMMTGDPSVTTLGDHTCGSSGNPTMIHLPLQMTVSVPQWIDYLPDGTPLDERGFQPQLPFTPTPGAFEGERDDLLAAALARLGDIPLP